MTSETRPEAAPPRIVAFAYSCEPGEGSEPGAGWILARLVANVGEVWVITRIKNRSVIEPVLASIPERDRLHVEYVDLPRWANFWKRGGRLLRTYYVVWQVAAMLRARKLHRRLRFDLSWHLTMSNVWLGSLAALIGTRFVYGPIGGGTGAPWSLWRSLGMRGVMYESARSAARWIGRYLNPLARLSWRRADLILVQNKETARWFPEGHRHKCVVFQHVIMGDESAVPVGRRRAGLVALFAARLIPWKGAALALRALVHAPGWELVICGDGPDRGRLERAANDLGVKARVRFLGKVPRTEVQRLMREEARVFLFPSLHDEGSFATGEAIRSGLPVVCVDRGGPPIVAGAAGIAVDGVGNDNQVARRLARALSSTTIDELDVQTRAEELTLGPNSVRLERILKRLVGMDITS